MEIVETPPPKPIHAADLAATRPKITYFRRNRGGTDHKILKQFPPVSAKFEPKNVSGFAQAKSPAI